MKLYRIWAIILRSLYSEPRSASRIAESFLWPIIDILLWGFAGTWLQKQNLGMANFKTVTLSAFVMWQLVIRPCYSITITVVEEIWSLRLINLFSSPLMLFEWIFAVMILGFIKAIWTLLFSAWVVFVFFDVNVFTLGLGLVPISFILLISGWAIGFLGAGMLIYWGNRIETVAWSLVWLFAPFCSFLYPVDVLPGWMQSVAKTFPMTYAFNGLRTFATTGILPVYELLTSFLLSIAFIVVAVSFFVFMFNKSSERGWSRLD